MDQDSQHDLLKSWSNYIHKKKNLQIKLSDELNDIYNKQTKLNYIIIFDIEFIRLHRNNNQLQTVNEMGGLVLQRINNFWHLVMLYHFNLPPLHKNINELYLMMTKYNTLSTKTTEKNIKLENELLDYFIPHDKDGNQIKGPKIKKMCFKLNGYVLKKNKKQHDLFTQIINNIFNDKKYKKRLIEDDIKFMKLTNVLFNKSYLIVKGQEDFKALNNHMQLLNIKPLPFENYADIAIYNSFLFKQCKSAELEKSYVCLEQLQLTQMFDEYASIIEKFTRGFKAHHPTIDSLMTWIIYNIFILKKITVS
jgi:hypothetical protein